MLVLALDTSTAAVSAAVVDALPSGVAGRATRSVVNARGHGELLAPTIADCLAAAGATPADLGAVVVGTGPGPFTGLRVGLVTAAVLSEALAIPAYGVCSLDAIASRTGGDVLVMTDARRKEVYWARYDAAGNRLEGPNVNRPADVPLDGTPRVAGAGARLYRDAFVDATLLDVDHPPPTELVGRALDRLLSGEPGDPLTPLYLRRPDAVVPATSKSVTP